MNIPHTYHRDHGDPRDSQPYRCTCGEKYIHPVHPHVAVIAANQTCFCGEHATAICHVSDRSH